MQVRFLTTPKDFARYDAWVRVHPHGNLWQSLAWKTYQEALGREVRIYASTEEQAKSQAFSATALVIIDRTIGGFSVWDIPRGPLVSEEQESRASQALEVVLTAIERDARKARCLSLLMSPRSCDSGQQRGYRRSNRHVQPEASLILDLTQSEETILQQMHPKGRYNIKVAEKHHIVITEGTFKDIDEYYRLAKATGQRDHFKIPHISQYSGFLKHLEGSFLLIARHDDRALAALMGVIWNNAAIYYYGASLHAYRHLMAPYALQWAAIRRCKEKGATSYDLLGISPPGAPPSDPWQGITDFKRKFGGSVVSYSPEQISTLRPWVRKALEWKRRVLG